MRVLVKLLVKLAGEAGESPDEAFAYLGRLSQEPNEIGEFHTLGLAP